MTAWTSDFGAYHRWFDRNDPDELEKNVKTHTLDYATTNGSPLINEGFMSWVPACVGPDPIRTGRNHDFTPATATPTTEDGPYKIAGDFNVDFVTLPTTPFVPSSNILIANRDLEEVVFELHYDMRLNSGTRSNAASDAHVSNIVFGSDIGLLYWPSATSLNVNQPENVSYYNEDTYDHATGPIYQTILSSVLITDSRVVKLFITDVPKGAALMPYFSPTLTYVMGPKAADGGADGKWEFYYESINVKARARQ